MDSDMTNILKKIIRGTLPSDTTEVFNKALNVNPQNGTTEIIDLYLSSLVQTLTIQSNVAVDDLTCTVAASVGEPVVDNMICLRQGTAFFQAEILAVAANGANWDLTLDTPFDYAFTAGSANGFEGLYGCNVDGSGTSQIFSINMNGLQAGEKWHITRIILAITDATAMDDAKFGGITALTNGIVLRYKNTIYKNIFNIKNNSEFALRAYDLTYSDKAPAGLFGLRVRRSFGGPDKNDVVIELAKDTDDELQLIIQDDLTGLSSFKIVAQGHRREI